MFKPEDYINYHCPRWDDLPDIGLYMDQVVSVLEKHLAIFSEDEESKIVTSTMINNYVKQRVVAPPHKKRYERLHLAYFFAVCILKRFLNISEISAGMTRLLEKFEPEVLYDMFCNEVEYSLRHAFAPNEYPELPLEGNDDDKVHISVIRAVTNAYANVLYARYIIGKYGLSADKSQKESKDTKKE